MLGLVVMEGMTLLGHPLITNKMLSNLVVSKQQNTIEMDQA